MIDPISLLLILYAVNRGKAAAAPKGGAPRWPSTTSPPPNMRAFKPRKTAPPPPPAAATADSGTPLSQLHNDPPVPPPAAAIDKAKHKATAALRRASKPLAASADPANSLASLHKTPPVLPPAAAQVIRRRGGMALTTRRGAPAAKMSSALVSQLQAILGRNGVQVPRDGLFGPKTASAWQSLAKRKGLPGTITREGPKLAKVVTQTFEQLSTPPIP